MFIGELVWNREFHFVTWCTKATLEEAKESLISIRDSGDGARVKKVRVVDEEGTVLWTG